MPRLSTLALLPLLALLSACSQFDQRWNATPMPASVNPAAPLAGKWEGSWQSDANAYQGILQAVIVPASPSSDGSSSQTYRASIKQSLFELLNNEQFVTLKAVPGEDGKFTFTGKVDRGSRFGGIHYYDGYVTEDVLFCDYTSDKDCGTFKMHRLVLANQ